MGKALSAEEREYLQSLLDDDDDDDQDDAADADASGDQLEDGAEDGESGESTDGVPETVTVGGHEYRLVTGKAATKRRAPVKRTGGRATPVPPARKRAQTHSGPVKAAPAATDPAPGGTGGRRLFT